MNSSSHPHPPARAPAPHTCALIQFGVYTRAQLAAFVSRNLPEFSLVIPLNELTDGLLIMKQILNWELVDLTYLKVNIRIHYFMLRA